MAATVWKGHLTFGLISIPVKMMRAARAEKISFRQLHRADHSRVRRTYLRDEPLETPEVDEDEALPATRPAPAKVLPGKQSAAFRTSAPPARPAEFTPPPAPAPPPPALVNPAELVKGYEFAPDRFVVVTKDDLAKITVASSREIQILEFVRLAEIDPIYYETSYYLTPDRAGERPYALLLQALRESGFVALAQLAMHNREHVVVIRPGRTGMVLHTMFYGDEIRRDDEYRADTSAVAAKELELAKRLIEALASPFDPGKYKDSYREKLNELIAAKVSGEQTYEAPEPRAASVVNILDALQQSLSKIERKPPAAEGSAKRVRKARGK
jgi:DNA end-binding protein Ku